MKIIKKGLMKLLFLIVNLAATHFGLYAEIENDFVVYTDDAVVYIESSLLKHSIEQLLNKIRRHDLSLSDNCMIFCEKIASDCKEFTKTEIEEALPELLTIIVKRIEHSKAFRPDAPGNSDGSPVGGLFTCDNITILQALNKLFILIKQCCALSTFDFSGTFTVLNNLVQDLQGTYTALNTIENIIATDFNGIFTALNACCEAEAMDFSGVFTTLNALNETITSEFNGTFTALNECSQTVANDFSGVFTTLNDISETITTEFNGTFTALECLNLAFIEFNGIFTALTSLENTITAEFNGTLTSIAACCQTLAVDFSGIFTILADITATVTTDFNGSFTVIAFIDSQLASTFTVFSSIENELINEFNGTFTVLSACCAATAEDFNGVFTTLNELDNTVTQNFNGTFTALAACCQGISNDFNGIFTAINDIDETIIIDFNGIFTALNQLTEVVESTFTVYNALNETIVADFNGIFTALNECCTAISSDFNGAFTVLNAIDETINTGFNGTFTAINECFKAIDSDFSGIFTSLNAIDQIIVVDFEGIYTALETVANLPCSATPITTSTTISLPGYYCLANDISGGLVIAANNVTVDLNRHTITAPGTGILISNAHNVIVSNGFIDTVTIGILTMTTNTILLSNLSITNCSDSGIVLNNGCNSTFMFDITIGSVNAFGINLNSNENCKCKNVTLFDCTGPVVLGSTGSISNCVFEDCIITDCVSNIATSTPFLINGGNYNQITRCSVINCQNIGGDFTALNLGSQSSVLELSSLQGLSSTGAIFGYVVTGINAVIQNCSVLDLESTNGSFGFLINSPVTTLNTCLVQTITSILGGSAGTGFLITQSGANLISCEAYQVTGTGFRVEAAAIDSSLLNCETNSSSLDGFEIDTAAIFIGNCTSSNNGGFGFDVTVTGTIAMYGCFATHNVLGDYNANCPNVEPVNRQVGVFARGNYFI